MNLALRNRFGCLLGVALLLASGACKRDGQPSAAGGPLAALTADNGPSPLAYLPADAELVATIDWAGLRGSTVYKQHVQARLQAAIAASDDYGEFKALCGFDPVDEIGQFYLGMSGFTADGPPTRFVVVVTGLNKAKSLACFEKAAAEPDKQRLATLVDGNLFVSPKNPRDEGFAGTFATDTILVGLFTRGATPTAADLKALTTAGEGLGASPAYKNLRAQVKPGVVTLFIDGKAAFMKELEQKGIKVEALMGAVAASEGLAGHAIVRTASEANAKMVAGIGLTVTGQVEPMVSKFDVAHRGADVVISVELSAAKVQELMNRFGGALNLFRKRR